MPDAPATNGSRKSIEVLLGIMSLVGGSSGIYAISAARDYGSLVARVENLERIGAEGRLGGPERLREWISLRDRIQALEAEVKRFHGRQ